MAELVLLALVVAVLAVAGLCLTLTVGLLVLFGALGQLRRDMQEVAAWAFRNEDDDEENDPCGCQRCGADEILAANPDLRTLADQGDWLLAQNDRSE